MCIILRKEVTECGLTRRIGREEVSVSVPNSPEPRRFYRLAKQRLLEARVLFDASYFVGAVYLAGYSVECMFKALILNSLPTSEHQAVSAEFRGQRGHDYDWLARRYAQAHSPTPPRRVIIALMLVSTWDVSLRYQPGYGNHREASRFLTEVEVIVNWADSRI
jgi:hypothetical protein